MLDGPVPSLPPPWGVLYSPPNPDGTAKSCFNCMMWVKAGACHLHDPALTVTGDHVCGYHVFGAPMEQPHPQPVGMQWVDPWNSGLELVIGGTSCQTCVHYDAIDADGGACAAVVDPDSGFPAVVAAMGCCARWDDGLASAQEVVEGGIIP